MNSRILVVGPLFYEYNSNVKWSLERLGFVVDIIEYDIERSWNPIKKIINNLKVWKLNRKVISYAVAKNYSYIIMIRGYERLWDKTYEFLFSKRARLILFLQDGFSRTGVKESNLEYFYRIMLFDDIDKHNSSLVKYSERVRNFGVAIRTDRYYEEVNSNKSTDISFVGNVARVERLRIVKTICEEFPDIEFKVYGKFYSLLSPWSLIRWVIFPYKRCVVNRQVTSDEINRIYNNSKICLNIQHTQNVYGFNPRTIEIAATNAIQLTNLTKGISAIHGLSRIYTYENMDDLKKRIEYILKNFEFVNELKMDQAWISSMSYESKIVTLFN